MRGKESQIFRADKVPALSNEPSKKKEISEITEEEFKEKITEGERILAGKSEVTPEENTNLINRFFEIITIWDDKEKKEIKKLLENLTYEELEKRLGKQETALISHIITGQNNLLQQMKENEVDINLAQNFSKQKGKEMLPYRIRKDLDYLKNGQLKVFTLFHEAVGRFQFNKNTKENIIQDLKILLVDLEKELKEYKEFKREEEEKPIKISGFKIFNTPEIEGNEIIKKAVEILPTGFFSRNIKEIKYYDFIRAADKQYGIKGKAFAEIEESEESGKYNIVFYKISDFTKIEYLRKILSELIHEFGHTIDPRESDQKDSTLGEQLQMIIKREGVRAEEKEWSSYVRDIKNPDKQLEETLKSKEGLAEDVEYYLTNPKGFQESCPRRCGFQEEWLKKIFPGFNINNSLKAKKEYVSLINNLEKRAAEKTKKTYFITL